MDAHINNGTAPYSICTARVCAGIQLVSLVDEQVASDMASTIASEVRALLKVGPSQGGGARAGGRAWATARGSRGWSNERGGCVW